MTWKYFYLQNQTKLNIILETFKKNNNLLESVKSAREQAYRSSAKIYSAGLICKLYLFSVLINMKKKKGKNPEHPYT